MLERDDNLQRREFSGGGVHAMSGALSGLSTGFNRITSSSLPQWAADMVDNGSGAAQSAGRPHARRAQHSFDVVDRHPIAPHFHSRQVETRGSLCGLVTAGKTNREFSVGRGGFRPATTMSPIKKQKARDLKVLLWIDLNELDKIDHGKITEVDRITRSILMIRPEHKEFDRSLPKNDHCSQEEFARIVETDPSRISRLFARSVLTSGMPWRIWAIQWFAYHQGLTAGRRGSGY